MAKKKTTSRPQNNTKPSSTAPEEDELQSYNWIDGYFGHFSYQTIAVCFALLLLMMTVTLFITGREDRWQRAAQAAFQSNDWSTSIVFYEKLLAKENPSNPASGKAIILQLKLIRCHLELKQTAQAAKMLNDLSKYYKVVDKKNRGTAARFFSFQGWRYFQANQFETAQKNLMIALNIDKKNALAHSLFLKLALRNNLYEQASMHYQFVADNPKFAEDAKEYIRIMKDEFLQIPEEELADIPQSTS